MAGSLALSSQGRCLRMLLSVTFLLALACQDQRFVERQDRRYRRIDETLHAYQDRESRRPRQIQWVCDTYSYSQELRDQRLENTFQRISDRYDRDVHYFEREGPSLRARIEELNNGRPDRIPEVWAMLVY